MSYSFYCGTGIDRGGGWLPAERPARDTDSTPFLKKKFAKALAFRLPFCYAGDPWEGSFGIEADSSGLNRLRFSGS